MNIISPSKTIDTKKDVAVFFFDTDDELRSLISKLLEVDARTGMRVVTLLPEGVDENHPLTQLCMMIISAMDGAGDNGPTEEGEKLLNAAQARLENLDAMMTDKQAAQAWVAKIRRIRARENPEEILLALDEALEHVLVLYKFYFKHKEDYGEEG